MDRDRRTIAILEDDAGRVEAMRTVLARDLPDFAVAIHGTAEGMIVWIHSNLHQAAVISLDNDLLDPADLARDVGEGLDVAKALSGMTPCCPIILHTSNSTAARAMSEILGEAGWSLCRVIPFNDLEWIEGWSRMVRRLLDGGRG